MGEIYIFTLNQLNRILDTEQHIVIYGAGAYGKRIADFIISIGKSSKVENFWITHKEKQHDYRGIKISEAGEGYLTGYKDSLILIAVSELYMEEIVTVVQKYGRRYCCITPELYMELGKKHILELFTRGGVKQIVPFKKVDFLVTGFAKCGTTSLHKALLDMEDIYLSEKKESHFFRWYDTVENPMERLIEQYFYYIQEGQFVGMVEPSFDIMAEQVYDFFGSQVKIIFLVRNPIDAEFSYFKMISRSGGAMSLYDAYEQSGGVCKPDTFEAFFNQYSAKMVIDKYKYIDSIRVFLKHYPKEQIKIITFEEMIQNPRTVLNDLLKFIGSSCKYMQDDLPRENEGNYVMATIDGLKIAEKWGNTAWAYHNINGVSDKRRREIVYELPKIQKQYNLAEKIYDLKIPLETRKKMELYYNDSVRELEQLMNRDLSKIWF